MSARLDGVCVDIVVRGRWRRSAVRVLDDVSLDLAAGSTTALVGESGCGKSMIAAVLSGLLPPGSAATGRLCVGGEDFVGEEFVGDALRGHDPRWRRLRGHRVGHVPQSAATSFTPVRTIGDQLDEVVATLGGAADATELCRRVHLDPVALRLYPHELSGGMAQRAAIAAAIAGDPAILVADEPTSALDADLAAEIWELLAASARGGVAVLVITHDIETLRRRAATTDDRVVVMRAGRIVAQGGFDALAAADDAYVAEFLEAVR
ncbi:ATP-binding cassette domain-containing protein [Gordonia sp. 'Campus']|uniref:ATP-binding cassette domain-containing protein n=1 Tax=Gordonia sp. 'Campus' TaxID=2915824 RepID=UPI001EE40F86|nr:ATP-binding cassette domain-containing protein [Gordonia sp. 'Campus']